MSKQSSIETITGILYRAGRNDLAKWYIRQRANRANLFADQLAALVALEKFAAAPALHAPAVRWSAEDDARLRQLAGQGMTAAEIADQLNRTKAAVSARGSILGVAIRSSRPGAWSAEDDARLRELVGQGMTAAEIADQLNRTKAAVFSRISKLHLAPVRHARVRWSAEDDAHLRELAGQGKSVAEIADQLNRTKAAVLRQASTLGVAIRSSRACWSAEDDARLRELAGQEMTAEEVADQLDRTAAAVVHRARWMGVCLRSPRQWHVNTDQELRRLAAQEMTVAEIASKLGRTKAAVRARAARLGVFISRTTMAWSAEDDARLRQLAGQGMAAAEIAVQMGRTRDTVHARVRFLGINIKRPGAWSAEDDARLRRLAAQEMTVAEIASKLGRTKAAVRARAARLGVFISRTTMAWSAEDDARLHELLGKGLSRREIAAQMGRTHAAVQERTRKLGIRLRPKQIPWSAAEDRLLRELAARGMTAAEIAAQMEGRTTLAVQKRAWKLEIYLRVQQGIAWSAAEDRLLRELAARGMAAAEIAVQMGRTRGAVQERARQLTKLDRAVGQQEAA